MNIDLIQRQNIHFLNDSNRNKVTLFPLTAGQRPGQTQDKHLYCQLVATTDTFTLEAQEDTIRQAEQSSAAVCLIVSSVYDRRDSAHYVNTASVSF